MFSMVSTFLRRFTRKKRPSKPTSSTRNVQEGEQAKKKPISTAKKRVLTTKPPENRRTFSENSNNKSTSSEKEKEKKTTWLKFPSGRLKKTNQNHVEKSPNSVTTPKTRPVSTHSESRVILIKKGQQQTSKIDGQIDELSRASSESNLHVDGKNNKGAKPRKNDINNKIVEKKIDKKSVTKNNNKLDSNNTAYSLDSIHLQDIEQLKRRLTEMANENSSLISELEEKNTEINTLHKEIEKLKILKEDTYVQLEQLEQDNTTLRNRLRDVAHSPLSDNEKQQLLLESHRQHSSAPASIATNLADDGNGGDYTTCATPDSSSNVSEVSVACLQDKINQMQETHYSTNEELQATLQELTDLQKQLTELQQENDRLNEEKTLMFDSLCRQTERLNDSRSEVESLKQLLYREKNDADQFESAVEREQKLVDLLKSAQEERETFLVKIEQLSIELQDATQAILQKDETIVQLEDRVKTLECTLDAKHAEHKQLDQELAIAKDHCSGKQIEIDRLSDLLENARTKIGELEEDRKLSDKSELDELLDNARKEKDSLESEVAYLKEQWARSKNETEKLREQVSGLQEECKVTRNNAKSTQSDLEYKCEKLAKEKLALTEQLQQFQEAVNELQVQSQCQSEDKRQLSAVLSETQRNLSEAERKSLQLENELEELKRLRSEENEEWEKFQNDLLTSVRVANDFKTEAQQDLQKMILENKAHREKVRQLQAQIDKLTITTEPIPLRPTSFPNEDLATRRQKAALSRQNSRQSVKSLIESIESQGKPTKNVSRSSSASSISSLTSDIRSPVTNLATPSPGSPLRTTPEWPEVQMKTPLKEQQPNKIQSGKIKSTTDSKNDLKGKNEDGFRETILQKSIDFSRRNSYSDLSERKDPLNGLVKNGGSKRNALLKWCQNKTVGYRNIDITNFSSSWNDGLALCALLHTYLPDRIPYDSLTPQEKRRNFSLAFTAAESVGIPTTLNINDMIQLERPDWQQVMCYVTAIYKHFET